MVEIRDVERLVLPRLGTGLRWSDRALAWAALSHGATQKTHELRGLIGLLKRHRPLACVVEIGTASGGTFFAWCQLAEPRATLVSIDLPGGEFGGGYSEHHVERLRTYARRGQETHFLRADSHDLATRRELQHILASTPIDFLMIDGDHSYEGVRSDFEMYGPLVRPGGLIAFHDVLHHDRVPECQVDRFWNEIRHAYRHWEFLKPEHDAGWGTWGGIGVLESLQGPFAPSSDSSARRPAVRAVNHHRPPPLTGGHAAAAVVEKAARS